MSEDRFIELILKDLSGNIHPDERTELQYFLNDADYLKRYKVYKMYWSRHDHNYINNEALFQKVKLRIDGMETEENGNFENEKRSGKFQWFFRWQNAAAVVIIVSSLFLLYQSTHPDNTLKSNAWRERITLRGSKASFILPDGSRISLNSDSKIRFPEFFTGHTREVYLSGEAFFDVKKDPAHPFIIHTGKMNVKVLGTAFNIKAYPNEPSSETTLIRGSVEVTLKDRPEDKVILKPTEKLIVNYSSPAGTLKGAGEPKSNISSNALTQITYMQKQDSVIVETSWVQNKLIFQDESLDEVCRSLERWYNINIHINNEELKSRRITVPFKDETINEALKALSTIEPFQYKIQGNSVYIY